MATGQAHVAVWPGDGLGGFTCQRTIAVPETTSSALITVGDVDGDGRPDIVVGHIVGGTITVLRQQ